MERVKVHATSTCGRYRVGISFVFKDWSVADEVLPEDFPSTTGATLFRLVEDNSVWLLGTYTNDVDSAYYICAGAYGSVVHMLERTSFVTLVVRETVDNIDALEHIVKHIPSLQTEISL